MPSWKKVVTSGSDAALNSITKTGDFTLDVSGDISLDADGADILLKDGGTEWGRFKRDTSDFVIKSSTNDKDIIFKGVDDSSTVTALTLDMSDGGKAKFEGGVSGSFEGDGSNLTGINADTANIAVQEEGSSLTSQVSSIDFVGSSLTATTSGNAVTVTATSASPFTATGSYYAANDDIQVTGSFGVDGTITEQGYSIPELMEKMIVDASSTTFLNFTTVTNNSGEVLVTD